MDEAVTVRPAIQVEGQQITAPEPFTVYAADGRRLAQVLGGSTLTLPQGVYIIVIQNYPSKIVIK